MHHRSDVSTAIGLAEFDFSANSNWTRFSTPFIYYPTIHNPAYILCNIAQEIAPWL